MRSTSAEDMSTQAVSPVSILAGGGVPDGAAGAEAGADAGGAWAQRSPVTQSPRRTMSPITTTRLETLIPAPFMVSTVTARSRLARPCGCARRCPRVHEDLAVADVAGFCRAGEHGRDLVHQTVGHHDLDLDLGEEIHRVLTSAVELGVALLPAEAADLGDRHADDPDAGQGLLHVVELERLDDGLDLLHGFLPERLGLQQSCRETLFRSD